ncbi:MAG: Maf family protein [bacterium]
MKDKVKEDILILASNSPRRKAILEMLNIPFIQVPPKTDDEIEEGECSEEIATMSAKKKAESVVNDYPQNPILGADTIVTIDGIILRKPKDKSDARRMLRLLSGRLHTVISALCIVMNGRIISDCDKTFVRFRNITENEIAEYINTGEPLDKAGAYAVQGKGAMLIEEIYGDFYNVMGLPVAKLYRILNKIGINPISYNA